MARRLPEYDQVLALSTKVNPDTNNPYRPAEIAVQLGVNRKSVGWILKRNGNVYNPHPILPHIELLTPGEKAFFLGLNVGGMKAESRRWVNSSLEHVVVNQLKSKYRINTDHPLKKALDERKRTVMLKVFPGYADIRDSDTKTTAYMDPELFRFMVGGVSLLNSVFFRAESRVSPFTFALLATRFSEDMYMAFPELNLGRRVQESYKRLYDVDLIVQSRKNRAGILKASVQVPKRDRQKLLEGVIGSKAVRSLPFFGAVMGMDTEVGQNNELANGNSQLNPEEDLSGDGFFVDYEAQRNTAAHAAKRLFNDSNW